MEDCELNGSLRAGTRDATIARSSALSLASVTDEISLSHGPSSSLSEATTSSNLNRRNVSVPGTQIQTMPALDNPDSGETNDEALGLFL